MIGLIIVGVIVFLILLCNTRSSLIMCCPLCIASFVCAVKIFIAKAEISPLPYLITSFLMIISFLGPIMYEKEQDGWEPGGKGIWVPHMVRLFIPIALGAALVVGLATGLSFAFNWCFFILPVIIAIGLIKTIPAFFR